MIHIEVLENKDTIEKINDKGNEKKENILRNTKCIFWQENFPLVVVDLITVTNWADY